MADIAGVTALFVGDEFRHGEAAQPALTRPHAAADESLHLIGSGAALSRETDHRLRVDLLTPTHQR